MLPSVFNTVVRFLNMTVEWERTPDGKYGAIGPDGKWNGMVRLIMDDKVDIAVDYLTPTLERSKGSIRFGEIQYD